MHKFAHILRLGLKELTSLRHDSVLLLFLFYAFTVAIYMPAAGSVIGVHNASVALVDEDHSALSRSWPKPCNRRVSDACAVGLRSTGQGHGQRRVHLRDQRAGELSDRPAGRAPAGVQVNVDATAMSQAFMGAGYIGRIFQRELLTYSRASRQPGAGPADHPRCSTPIWRVAGSWR
jgi:ABC-2 type transport system permease protein